MAQSAVSSAVAALEGRHGARLVHRVGRNIAVTEAGTLFLAEARAVLARCEAAERVLADLGGLKRGTLNVHPSGTTRRSFVAKGDRDVWPVQLET